MFERKDEEPDFLTGMFENDCYPGDEVFTEDLKQLLEEIRGSFSDSTKEAAEDQDYYRDFTGCSKEEAESFARMVKKQILDRDWTALSESILYPIQIRSVTYESEEAFLAENWDTFWTDTFWQAIEEEDCAEMFGNSSGIMLGDGQIWFSGIKDENADAPLLKIIAIND